MKKGKMEMDQESLNLCKRLESGLNTMQSNMAAVLHLLRGNELDDESGMVNQLRSLKLDGILAKQRDDETRKIMLEKISSDKQVLENKIELLKISFEARLVKVEKWKDKVIWMAVGIGIGAGAGLKALIDLFLKK